MNRTKAFTLIELLVVVGIIVLLIGILVPVLGQARKSAYGAQTMTMLSNLQTSIDGYYQHFNAYPGPASPNQTAGPPGTKSLSGAQNLLLGLAYGVSDNPTGVTIAMPSGMSGRVAPTSPNGPLDRSRVRPDGQFEQLQPFFETINKTLSKPLANNPNAWPGGGMDGTGAPGGQFPNNFGFPVIVDSYPDALPVLFYRRLPSVGIAPSRNAASYYAPTSAANAAYHWTENAEYTRSATLKAVSGVLCPQMPFTGLPPNTAKGTMSEPADGMEELGRLVNTGSGPTATARGGYLLLSAGADRVYGSILLPASRTSDDHFIVGGN